MYSFTHLFNPSFSTSYVRNLTIPGISSSCMCDYSLIRLFICVCAVFSHSLICMCKTSQFLECRHPACAISHSFTHLLTSSFSTSYVRNLTIPGIPSSCTFVYLLIDSFDHFLLQHHVCAKPHNPQNVIIMHVQLFTHHSFVHCTGVFH